MQTFVCKKCGSLDVYIKENGTQVGLYCGDCGAWLKWLGKEERRLAERYIEERKNTATVTIQPVEVSLMSGKDRLLLDIIKELASDKDDKYGFLQDKINTLENVMKLGK